METREPKYGERVIYIDEFRKQHNALVTEPHGGTCCNLVYVSSDEKKHDTYGRQIERDCSCVHISCNEAKANCWAYPDEV